MWNRVALFQPFSKIETNIQTSTFNPNRNLAKIQSTNDNAEKRRKSALSTSVWQNAQEQGKLLRSGPHSELSERTCYLLDSDRVACIQSRVPYTNTANDAGLHRHRFVERYFAPCLVPRNIRGYVRDDFSSFDRKRPLACSARNDDLRLLYLYVSFFSFSSSFLLSPLLRHPQLCSRWFVRRSTQKSIAVSVSYSGEGRQVTCEFSFLSFCFRNRDIPESGR